jgi:hypothetical protein
MSTIPSTTARQVSEKDLIKLQNFRIELQNNHARQNYERILKTNEDVKKLAVLLKQEQNKINKINLSEYMEDDLSIKTIKSVNNNTILSLNPVADPDTYQVNINGQCLTVYSKNNMLLKPCQKGFAISDSQKLISKRIMTPLAAKTEMKSSYLNPLIVYPYNIFRSPLTGQCMSLNNDGDIIMKDCSANDIRQHWKISHNENICPM